MRKTEKKQKNENIYKKHSIDDAIVSFLNLFDKKSFNTQDKIFFLKEIAHLLNGGVSLFQAIEIIENSSDNFAVKSISKEIMGYLKKGKSLSYALNRMPEFFDESDYNIIKSGENVGNLNIVLESLAKEHSYLQEIKNKYISALMYPILLLVIAIVATLALFLLVLPSIFTITDGFVIKELPTSTAIAKNISEFLKNNFKIIGIISTFLIAFGGIFFSTQTGKKSFFGFLLQVPVLGKMTKYYYITKFCRYIKLMLKSGMNFLDIFLLLRDIFSGTIYQELIENIISGLTKGETIYDGLKYETKIIPSNVAVLIKVGEETANLQTSIENILQIYEEELNTLVNRLSKLIEPFMMIFIGGIIAFISMAVFGLIFQVMEGAGI